MLCSHRWLNQSVHPMVANSTSSMVLIGPFRNGLRLDTASVLNSPIVLSANALSYASPVLPIDAAMPPAQAFPRMRWMCIDQVQPVDATPQ